MNKLDQIKAIVCEVNKPDEIILQAVDLVCKLTANESAYDDDLEDTWRAFKKSYEKLKDLVDQHIIEGES